MQWAGTWTGTCNGQELGENTCRSEENIIVFCVTGQDLVCLDTREEKRDCRTDQQMIITNKTHREKVCINFFGIVIQPLLFLCVVSEYFVLKTRSVVFAMK